MSAPTATDWDSIITPFYQQGWVWLPTFLPEPLTSALLEDLQQQPLRAAGVGRQAAHLQDQQIRRDHTAWLDGSTPAQQQYLALMQQLQQVFNQRCLLGLFDFECHYARYQSGDFYQKHLDAFQGRSNRVLTTVTYLNSVTAGGALALYDEQDQLIRQFQPAAGGLIVFESERFPHEVLPATSPRFSIAGWFRRNNSLNGLIDPSR